MLRDQVEPSLMAVWETGAHYLLVHALALFALGLAGDKLGERAARLAGWSFVLGVVLFAGSLFAMALTGLRALGAITPLGGASFLFGWAVLVRAAVTTR